MSKERQWGWYWVRCDKDWEIAYWDGDFWQCRGTSHVRHLYPDTVFDEIDETPIKRNDQ